eukprot:Seg552.8 transcript_id=Seg552.8/GoldUCD/mRNA.D3Y31 product="hypothetical protein" protein_id=Seg552.8/GoldUCD/D3Y31
MQLRLPKLSDSNLSPGARYREAESAVQRKLLSMRKMQCDNVTAHNEIATLRLKMRGTKHLIESYRNQSQDMGNHIRKLKEKHEDEMKVLKNDCLASERQNGLLTRKVGEQQELINNLRWENEKLKGMQHSPRSPEEDQRKKFPPIQAVLRLKKPSVISRV